jgi:hypothetical protein
MGASSSKQKQKQEEKNKIEAQLRAIEKAEKTLILVEADLYNYLRDPSSLSVSSNCMIPIASLKEMCKEYQGRTSKESSEQLAEVTFSTLLLKCLLSSNPNDIIGISNIVANIAESDRTMIIDLPEIFFTKKALTAENLEKLKTQVSPQKSSVLNDEVQSIGGLSDNASSVYTAESQRSTKSKRSARHSKHEITLQRQKAVQLEKLSSDESDSQLRVRQAISEVMSPFRISALEKLKKTLREQKKLKEIASSLTIEKNQASELILALIKALLKDIGNIKTLEIIKQIEKDFLPSNQDRLAFNLGLGVTNESDVRPKCSPKQEITYWARLAFAFGLKPKNFFYRTLEVERNNANFIDMKLAEYCETQSQQLFSPLNQAVLTPLCQAYVNKLNDMTMFDANLRYKLMAILMIETTRPYGEDASTTPVEDVLETVQNPTLENLKKTLISEMKDEKAIDILLVDPTDQQKMDYLYSLSFLVRERPNQLMTFEGDGDEWFATLQEVAKYTKEESSIAYNMAVKLEKKLLTERAQQEKEEKEREQQLHVIPEVDEDWLTPSPKKANNFSLSQALNTPGIGALALSSANKRKAENKREFPNKGTKMEMGKDRTDNLTASPFV